MRLPDKIETERLTLRPPRPADSGPMTLYAGDRRVAEMLEHVPHPYPPGAAEAFIERAAAMRAAEHVWVMDAGRIDGPEFIGVISLKPGADNAVRRRLGYWVGPPFWNTGYASEAAAAVVRAARAAGAEHLDARVVSGNEASAHVLINAGFVETGEEEFFSVGRGAMTPHRLFSLDLTEKARP
ncbi:GNAT family N-acetyltransferase [Pikeienuella piscinae]|uniref:GNAT family N-acetyltransferase n=1 Tax=Pikeienuella piscinae TaxID=2748098 RepID=A0A7L5BU68_9RHOB|nr:GNAT family protein [Pikeienuella piscinae]QIE54751.1 GNAT family N-acetyltransferase [Pikeienuella piscinae]